MEEQIPHRKRVRHYDEPGHAHLLTFSCYQRLPLLTGDLWRRWLSESIDAATTAQRFWLAAFVYMPEHVHLVVWPTTDEYQTGRFLAAVKRPCSYSIKGHLETLDKGLLEKLTVRERPGKRTFRFWQEGGGHDRNLTGIEAVAKATEYLHNNPVRRGLCQSPDQWKWSSWRYYHHPEDPPDPELPKVQGFPPM